MVLAGAAGDEDPAGTVAQAALQVFREHLVVHLVVCGEGGEREKQYAVEH